MGNLKIAHMAIYVFAIRSQFIWDKKDIHYIWELVEVAANKHTFIICLLLFRLLDCKLLEAREFTECQVLGQGQA